MINQNFKGNLVNPVIGGRSETQLIALVLELSLSLKIWKLLSIIVLQGINTPNLMVSYFLFLREWREGTTSVKVCAFCYC